jgi:hypothetical protein
MAGASYKLIACKLQWMEIDSVSRKVIEHGVLKD